MPDAPAADLGSLLYPMLLRTLGILILVAAVTALLLGSWTRINRRRQLIGTHGQQDPDAHRTGDDSWFEPRSHRRLRILLALLWIVDGLLQAQPRMPAGFVPRILQSGIDESPAWLAALVGPLARLWGRHPVVADATTIWIQVGIGLLLLLIRPRGALYKIVLIGSAAWSAVVWVTGEFLGGLLNPGASWLSGAPGAVLVYAGASGLLLAAHRDADGQRLAIRCRRLAAAWFLVGAIEQLIPWEGNWSGGPATVFRQASSTEQPDFLAAPIRGAVTLSSEHPRVTNFVIVLLLLVAGLGLALTSSRAAVFAALILCAMTWWLAQDFGVLGGFGTDPNTAFALSILLIAGWPATAAATARQPAAPTRARPGARRALRAGGLAAAFTAAVLVPAVLAVSLSGPSDAAAVTADSSGGVLRIAGRSAPDFSLVDQKGRIVTMAGSRGKLTLVTFLDPVCSDDCPVVANQIAVAIRRLGSLADRVQVVAIDTNPIFIGVSDVAAFTTSHGLDDLAGWHFLSGPEPRLRAVLDAYSISVQVPAVGMVAHSEGIYFVDASGRQVAYLGDGAAPSLSSSYSDVIDRELRKLLR